MLAAAATRTSEKRLIEDQLRRVVERVRANGVQLAMEHAIGGEAGRVRPLLALRVARLAQAPQRLALRGAIAVELLHSASLVVDDLPCMDNDLLRRGLPSVHAAFGEATAILAAHSLVALAARHCVAGCAAGDLAEMVRFQVKLLAALDPESLAGGQEMDLTGRGSRAEINERKTVPLFRLAVEAGLIGSAIREEGRFALRQFGREFGMAFQLVDDVLDGETGVRPQAREQLYTAERCLRQFGPDAAPLAGLVERLHERLGA